MYIIQTDFNEFPSHSVAPNLINTLASVRVWKTRALASRELARGNRSKPTNTIPYDQCSEEGKNAFIKSIQRGLPEGDGLT